VTPFAGSRPSNLLHELSATVSRWSLWEVRWGREGEGEGRCIVAWGEVAAGGQESEVELGFHLDFIRAPLESWPSIRDQWLRSSKHLGLF
jgi:hypothetical protein